MSSLRQDEDISPATHQPNKEEHKPKPTLFELHEMLVDIQINVNNILREIKRWESWNQQLVDRPMTGSMKYLKTHLQQINNQYQKVENSFMPRNGVWMGSKRKSVSCTSYKTNWSNIPSEIPGKSTECRRARIHRQKRWCLN